MNIKLLYKAFRYRPGRLYYLTLTVSVLTILFVTTNLVKVNRNVHQHLLMNDFNVQTIQFLTDMFLKDLDKPTIHDKRVVGLTVYRSDGTTVYGYGSLTEDPRLHDQDNSKNIYMNESKNLVIINYELNGLLDNMPNGRPKEFGGDFQYDLIIHVEILDERYFKGLMVLKIIQYGLYFISVLIYVLMLHTFHRSQKFKNELDSQKNLVILGTALRTLTHEMKNPLAAIRLQSGYMRKLYPEDLKQETALIDSEVERLSRIMDLVRDYLKEPVGEPEIFGVVSYLEELKQLFPSQINWSFPNQKPSIFFDKDKFRSVMENLINNAMESHSPLEDISIECLCSRKFVNIKIRDKGSGIPSSIRDKLFDPFFTTKSKGSGAGLMIVKRFVEAVEGQINIDSIPDEETIITLRLPYKQEVTA